MTIQDGYKYGLVEVRSLLAQFPAEHWSAGMTHPHPLPIHAGRISSGYLKIKLSQLGLDRSLIFTQFLNSIEDESR